jgi:hypothetical protein
MRFRVRQIERTAQPMTKLLMDADTDGAEDRPRQIGRARGSLPWQTTNERIPIMRIETLDTVRDRAHPEGGQLCAAAATS